MKITKLILVILLFFAAFGCKESDDDVPTPNNDNNNNTETNKYFPQWADTKPQNVIKHAYVSSLTASENGKTLAATMQKLKSGDKLIIEKGIYSIDKYFDLVLKGTSTAPIWIEAEDNTVITRADAKQNILNLGVSSPTSYVCIRGIEFKGGSTGLKLYSCKNVWIDKCHIHHTGGVGIAANTKNRNTEFIYITQNELHNLGHTGEGMYLGANNADAIMSKSIIALNHVHHTDQNVSQGDGIELKQGSWGNLIAENLVHDCGYPCIIAYGTGGKEQNIIEKNICYNSKDNAMQIQGEAIVRNNLVINGAGSAFASKDHQGKVTNLQVIHNTFINTKRATNMDSWSSKKNMVFANNVVYSQKAESIRFPSGASGVILAGNVVFGAVLGVKNGFIKTSNIKNPLVDFVGLSWDASSRNALPVDGSVIIGAGDTKYATKEDLNGNKRSGSLESGCYDK